MSNGESHYSRIPTSALTNEASYSNRSSLSSNTTSKFDQKENTELPIENLQQPKENLVNGQQKKKSKQSNYGVNKIRIQNTCKKIESIQKQNVDVKQSRLLIPFNYSIHVPMFFQINRPILSLEVDLNL